MEEQSRLCAKFGFSKVSDLGRYLGMPLLFGRVGVGSFQFIMDKVRNCLGGWDVRKLSLVGRLTLVKTVLMAIPNYFMATTRILISICKEIEKLTRNFYWGFSVSKKKISFVNWKDSCKLMVNEGLGIRHIVDQNKLFLLKLGYNMIANTEDLTE
ncbi:Retrovirus-related Pol polyprotein LINE-1 [Gossypium australe]|uniref:Retrovirus-related Pol polyprotein LINE-1 n=1 Tax=Gossypium australe TaxID=47621 RepID=A0A5B6WU62_9ROSI|nr:Retrovirus-related Pol polyprotein LINE-1 [Gossypium australe]